MDRLRRPKAKQVPIVQPTIAMAFLPPHRAGFLGLHLPSIPGVPDTDTLLIRGIKNASEEPAFSTLECKEREAVLAALAETAARARYHKLRFDEALVTLKTRREAVGGPVVTDWVAAPPLIWEGIAFLGAARTTVDILIYIAARRAGKSVSAASGWEASAAISPKKEPGGTPPTKYDVPEVVAIRALGKWFEELNVYRNVVYHRGWGEQSYGFFTRADTAEEAELPKFNALLLPDFSSLVARKPQHEWTYSTGARLDELVASIDDGLGRLLLNVYTNAWGCSVPQPGTAQHPSCALYLPSPALLDYIDVAEVPLFTSRSAAKKFSEYPADAHVALRAIRPTLLDNNDSAYLIWVSPEERRKPYRLRIYEMVDGRLVVTHDVPLDPKTDVLNDWAGVVVMRMLGTTPPALYTWQPTYHS